MPETVDFASGDAAAWRAAMAAYDRRIASLNKPDLLVADSFLAKPELVHLLKWKLSRGKWSANILRHGFGTSELERSWSCQVNKKMAASAQCMARRKNASINGARKRPERSCCSVVE